MERMFRLVKICQTREKVLFCFESIPSCHSTVGIAEEKHCLPKLFRSLSVTLPDISRQSHVVSGFLRFAFSNE